MDRTRVGLVMAGVLLGVPFLQAEWRPANGPLLTRWAKDVDPNRPHPEYPRPQMARPEWSSLNGIWQLAEAKAGETPPLGRDLEGRILVPFPVESALSGVMKPVERVWYRRTFEVPDAWTGRRVLLQFGAVNWEAIVWVNGQKVGEHRGGYDAFGLDITDALRPKGPQEIVVGVWNPVDGGTQPRGKQVRKPGGIYYTPSTGIWQTAWIEPVNPTSLESLTVDPDAATGTVELRAGVRGPSPHPARLHAAIKDRDKVVAEGSLDKGRAGPLRLEVKSPRLWSPEAPNLYDLEVSLVGEDGKVLDRVQSYLGFRTIQVARDDRGVNRMTLNGKPYFQVGPLDQGFWPDGLYTAPTDEALRYDIEMTKKLGFNMARKHVKVEPQRWYYWCDKLGLLVWQDMPSGDRDAPAQTKSIQRTPESTRQYEHELARMIAGRRNHPSIVMWVPFNEGWGQFDTPRIVDLVKKLDPGRLVDCASGWHDFPVGDVHDIHAYPGPASPKPSETRAAVLGEFGGLGLAVDGHTWTKQTWGYRGTKDKADLTRKYERLLRRVYELKDSPGLSAAVYTQTTDVETEANGLMTYDRAVIKVDPERVAAANRGDFTRVPGYREVVPTSLDQAQEWRYTTERPSDGWNTPTFDDAGWKSGPGGFGRKGTPGGRIRTEWTGDDIWLRREVTLPECDKGSLWLLLHHDEDAEVYINGVLAAKVEGFATGYDEVPLRPEAAAALKSGKNMLAVHCHQTQGGQYIDVGLVEIKPPSNGSGR